MKIGILSDTHDHLTRLHQALKFFRDERCSALIHAGDLVSPFAAKLLAAWASDLHVCYGNNEGEREFIKTFLPGIADGPLPFTIGNRSFVLIHDAARLKPQDYARAQIVVTGHTHDALIETKEDRLWINPGENCGWLTGRATVAVLDTDSLAAEIYPLLE